MQHIALLLIMTLGLSSCFQSKTPETPTDTGKTVSQTEDTSSGLVTKKDCTPLTPMDENALNIWKSGKNPEASSDAVSSGNLVLVNYTLRTCTEDGEILDTSREADAKTAGTYNSGRVYEPFQTIIGSHQTVRGFEYGLIGMKKGERKTIAVAPSDGYAEERIPKYYIAPEYTLTLDKSLFSDTITETFSKENLGEKAKDIKVGSTLTGGANNDIPAKVMKISGNDVTIEIDNSKNNPFHGKELTVGTSANVEEGVTFTVKSLQGTGVTFDVVNTKSPFVNNFVVGASAELPAGKLIIRAIEENDVVIEDLSGTDPKKSSLFFDVEVVDIK